MASGLHGAGTVDAASPAGEALNTEAVSATTRLHQMVEQTVLDRADDHAAVIHALVKVTWTFKLILI